MSQYPSLADNFAFCNKKVIAYITNAMPNDIFEFRIQSYHSTNGDNSIELMHQYYDFYPSYFYNLEEITNKFAGAYVASLHKKDFAFGNPFSVENIHQELIEIFIQNSDESEIKLFIEFLLKNEGYYIDTPFDLQNTHFDIVAKRKKKTHLFEIFHRKPRSVIQIEDTIGRIKTVTTKHPINFIFTSFPGEKTMNILKRQGVNMIVLQDLFNKYFLLDNSQIIHWYIKSKLPLINIKNNSLELKTKGENLITRLGKCPAGVKNWSEYESIGIDIFEFLFSDNFNRYLSEEQIENNLKNHRRDLLVNNNYSHSTSFWADVKTNYNCSAIIVEFKNYAKKLNSTTLFSLTKYAKKNVGNFAIVLSRKGIDVTAKKEQSELFSNNKLIIDFSDNELIEMIREKIIGKDPIDRLESKKFELVKKT